MDQIKSKWIYFPHKWTWFKEKHDDGNEGGPHLSRANNFTSSLAKFDKPRQLVLGGPLLRAFNFEGNVKKGSCCKTVKKDKRAYYNGDNKHRNVRIHSKQR